MGELSALIDSGPAIRLPHFTFSRFPRQGHHAKPATEVPRIEGPEPVLPTAMMPPYR
jgi:hypothetical protein